MPEEELNQEQALTGEETPATEVEETKAEATTAETLPEGEEEEDAKKPSKGVQRRIDELVKEREEWKRIAFQSAAQGQQTPPPQPPQSPTVPAPRQEDYETYEEYLDARTEWRAEKKLADYQAAQAAQALTQKRETWFRQGESKYKDFRQMVGNPAMIITNVMRDALFESDMGADLAYYLAKNPSESLRIANLPPLHQVLEMGRLETKLTDIKPKPRTTTAAPSPTSPAGGKDVPIKKPEDMTYEEYRAWREGGGGR